MFRYKSKYTEKVGVLPMVLTMGLRDPVSYIYIYIYWAKSEAKYGGHGGPELRSNDVPFPQLLEHGIQISVTIQRVSTFSFVTTVVVLDVVFREFGFSELVFTSKYSYLSSTAFRLPWRT